MPKITFVGDDDIVYQVDTENGLSLMEAARNHDVPGIEAECGGAGACATCHVYIDDVWLEACGERGQVEDGLLDLVEDRRDGSRLSCQISLTDALDGLVARIPEDQGF